MGGGKVGVEFVIICKIVREYVLVKGDNGVEF